MHAPAKNNLKLLLGRHDFARPGGQRIFAGHTRNLQKCPDGNSTLARSGLISKSPRLDIEMGFILKYIPIPIAWRADGEA